MTKIDFCSSVNTNSTAPPSSPSTATHAAGVQYLDEQTATVQTLTDSGWTTTVVETDYTVDAEGVATDWDTTVTVGTGATATPTILTGSQIGGIFGSAIGQAIGGGNVFASVGAQAALSTVLGTVGHSLQIYFNDTHLSNVAGSAAATLEEAVAVSLNGVGSALGNNLFAAGSGAISSFLTAELAETLGFNTTTFGGQLFSYVAGAVTSSVLNNVARQHRRERQSWRRVQNSTM